VVMAGASVAEAAREAAAAEPEAARAARAKRRKGEAGEAAPSAALEQRCRQELSGHSQCASSVAWPTADTIISGSWDHSVSPPLWPLGRNSGGKFAGFPRQPA
jgi:hypothetical protein